MMPRFHVEDTMAHSILRGGRVLDIAAGTAEPADVLIADDTIQEIGLPGCPAPECGGCSRRRHKSRHLELTEPVAQKDVLLG